MMEIEQIIELIESIASPELSAEWDNCGLLINTGKIEIEKVMTALEITRDVIKEAKEKKADLIITHHPVIFDPLKKIDRSSIPGEYIVDLIKSGISVYCAHTNFDEAKGGNNDHLASLLNLKDGELNDEMSFKEVWEIVKRALKIDDIKTVGDPSSRIKKVGLCAGAGSDMIPGAAGAGLDLFITGDIKYHDALYASETGLCLIDAGHYGTEKFFAENIALKLAAAAGGKIEVFPSCTNIDPFNNITGMI